MVFRKLKVNTKSLAFNPKAKIKGIVITFPKAGENQFFLLKNLSPFFLSYIRAATSNYS
jgi:hypothetical protein